MDVGAKGARGEREWAAVLSSTFPHLDFARGVQTRGGGSEAADVFGLPGFHWEVKRVERLNVWAALAQARRDAAEGEIPVLAYRRNKEPWIIGIDAQHFLDILVARHVAPCARCTGS